jgi:hypothetical protein
MVAIEPKTKLPRATLAAVFIGFYFGGKAGPKVS